MGFDEALEDFLLGCRGAHEHNTVQYYRYTLKVLVRWCKERGCKLDTFSRRSMREYLAWRSTAGGKEGKGVSQTSRRHDVIAARQFFAFCHHEGYVEQNALHDYPVPKISKPRLNMPHADELRALLDAVDRAWSTDEFPMLKHVGPSVRNFFRLRDRAILLVLLQSGIRPGELLALKRTAYQPEHPHGPSLLVPTDVAKDDEDRVVPLQSKTVIALKAYEKARGKWWTQTRGENLFVSRTGKPLDRNAYGKNFRRYRELAGLSGFSLYGLKHYAATRLAEIDISVAADITGVSIETLKARYVHNNPQHIRARLEEADPVGKALGKR